MLCQAYSPKDNARLVVMMLEVLAFPLDTNDVVNSLETMERKIKEFERYANIENPEFLKIGIVIRQAEKGPMRMHLIMNSHRLATFQDIKTVVTNVKQAQSAVKARSGDAVDVDAFTKGSKGASKGSGKKQDSEVVCWYCEKKGHRASDCRKKQRDSDSGKSKGSKKDDSKREEQQGKVQRLQVWQDRSHVEGSQIQRNECIRSWRRVGTDGMHRNGKHRFGRIGDWSSAVAGKRSQNSCWNRFVCCVADNFPMLDMPGKAKSYRPASGKLLPDLGARKVQVKLRDGSPRYVNPRVADTHRALMAVSEMNDMGHVVFFPRSDRRHQGIRVPREQWHETGARESEWSVRVAGRTCSIQPEYIEEQHTRSVFFTFCSGTDQGHDGQGYDCGPPKLTRMEVLEVAT